MKYLAKNELWIRITVVNLETSVFESFTVASLPYRPCG